MEKLVNFSGDTLFKLIYISSGKFSKFHASNVILFQIKVFSEDVTEITLASCFTKVIVHPL